MWTKRKETENDPEPKLRDEFEELLQDTLPELRPLRSPRQPKRPRDTSRRVDRSNAGHGGLEAWGREASLSYLRASRNIM